jgi:hypothetical protein
VKVTPKRTLRQHDATDKAKLFSFKHVSSLRMANRLLQRKEYNQQITLPSQLLTILDVAPHNQPLGTWTQVRQQFRSPSADFSN